MQDTIDVVVTWAGTPLSVERLARGEKFTLGPARGDAHHFLCDHPSIPTDAFVLAEHRADGVIIVRAAADMDLMVNGRAVDLPEVALERGARAHVAVGPLSIAVVSDTRAATVLATNLVDGRLVRVSGIAMALHAGFVVALLFTRAPEPIDELARIAPDWRSTVSTTMRPSKPVPAAAAEVPAAATKRASAKPAKPKKADDARALAMTAIGQLFGSTDATSSVFGDNGSAADLSGLRGARTAMGGDDIGIRRGPGGPTSLGTIHTGPIGDGECKGCEIDLVGRGKARADLKVETPVHSDGLSREEIQRVLNRVMSQIKYCYEKELNREPELGGKLVMSWVIGKTGLVTSSKAASSSLQRAGGTAVDSCVDRVISRLQFPAPRGGTEQVVVTYPFVFSSAGQ